MEADWKNFYNFTFLITLVNIGVYLTSLPNQVKVVVYFLVASFLVPLNPNNKGQRVYQYCRFAPGYLSFVSLFQFGVPENLILKFTLIGGCLYGIYISYLEVKSSLKHISS